MRSSRAQTLLLEQTPESQSVQTKFVVNVNRALVRLSSATNRGRLTTEYCWNSPTGPVATFFHSSNDLDAGFAGLTETPETLYVLELSLENAKLGSGYQSLKVKVDRAGTQVQARRGYYLSKPGKDK